MFFLILFLFLLRHYNKAIRVQVDTATTDDGFTKDNFTVLQTRLLQLNVRCLVGKVDYNGHRRVRRRAAERVGCGIIGLESERRERAAVGAVRERRVIVLQGKQAGVEFLQLLVFPFDRISRKKLEPRAFRATTS
ncbi:MAG: hypothetical protein AAFN78_17980 [Pseudomonadota bacterium]